MANLARDWGLPGCACGLATAATLSPPGFPPEKCFTALDGGGCVAAHTVCGLSSDSPGSGPGVHLAMPFSGTQVEIVHRPIARQAV